MLCITVRSSSTAKICFLCVFFWRLAQWCLNDDHRYYYVIRIDALTSIYQYSCCHIFVTTTTAMLLSMLSLNVLPDLRVFLDSSDTIICIYPLVTFPSLPSSPVGTLFSSTVLSFFFVAGIISFSSAAVVRFVQPLEGWSGPVIELIFDES